MNNYGYFPFKLRSCVWEITLSCSFNCAYCGSRGGKARENELTTEECLRVCRELAAMGCRRVSLIGGEVFMRKDWAVIAGELTARDITTCIITNGFSMNQEIINTLKEIGIESIAVSLDGPERVHDAYRMKGSYRKALACIQALADAEIPVSVISALRKDNAGLLPELFETLKQYPIFAWQIQACSPMGNAEDNGVETMFDPVPVMKFIASVQGTVPFYLAAADNIGYFGPEETSIRARKGFHFGGCSAGLTTCGIDSVGNVRGCESMYDERFTEGNLREKSLEEIWTDPEAFLYNRAFDESLLTGKCASCPQGAYCAAGCRSYNFFTTGKLYENCLCPGGKG